jgi:Asp-tRNA(Asn)/Glu-tRNA(Gln) amidotransferase A subunit family amidase
VKYCKRKSLGEFFGFSTKREIIKRKFSDMCINNNLDAIITPMTSFPPVKDEGSEILLFCLTFGIFSAAFDLPSGVVPTRFIKQNEEIHTDNNNDFLSECFKFNAKGSSGLPAAVQIIGMPYQDEKTLANMKLTDDIWKFREFKRD